MSLSWITGIPIARVDGGSKNKRILHLNTGPTTDEIEITNPFDYLTDAWMRSRFRKMSAIEVNKLRRSIINKREPEDESLAVIYREAMHLLSSLAKKEIRLDSGKFVPLPPANGPDSSSRVYTAGPTGSGKSTFSGSYIRELKKKRKKMPVFIFSKVEHDEVLDKLKPIRIKIDESIIEKPIELNELKNSICVFDDIDSFTNNKLRDAVSKLRSEVLSEGRHHNITAICTNHQLCDYQKTRNLLLECSLVTFFPSSGGSYGITRFLKAYVGLSKEEIKKVLTLPSRWVSINKTFPMYCLYETGCFLLGQADREPINPEFVKVPKESKPAIKDSEGGKKFYRKKPKKRVKIHSDYYTDSDSSEYNTESEEYTRESTEEYSESEDEYSDSEYSD